MQSTLLYIHHPAVFHLLRVVCTTLSYLDALYASSAVVFFDVHIYFSIPDKAENTR